MNRRTFLKSLGIACGAAVVCPGELLKSDPWIKAAALRKKNAALGAKLCYGKHGQHCCCNSCVIDIMADCLPPLPWKHYYTSYSYDSSNLDKLRAAFKNTKFKSPVPEDTKAIVGIRSKCIYFNGQQLYYNEDLGIYEEGYY